MNCEALLHFSNQFNKVNNTGSRILDSIKCEPQHEISNNVIWATTKASDQPAHMRSLIRAFACRLSIL